MFHLFSLGIVKKETPFGEDSARKTIYSIEDNMFLFWYRFIPENISVSKTRQQVEIDIMGTADKNTALFGECKWTNEKVDLSVLERLIEKSRLFHYENKHYYLFAKSGFTKGCMEKADKARNITLVSYEDMLP